MASPTPKLLDHDEGANSVRSSSLKFDMVYYFGFVKSVKENGGDPLRGLSKA